MSKSKIAGLGLAAAVVGSGALFAQSGTSSTGGQTTGMANTLVNTCANIRHGENVWIHGGTTSQELLEDIAIELRKIGAHPLITIGSDRLTQNFYTQVPSRFDSQEPTFALRIAEIVDAVFTIDYSERPDLLADIPATRLATHAKAFAPIEKKLLDRGVIQVNLGNGLYPTTARARQFGIPQKELATIFWNGVKADYDALQSTGEKIQTFLGSGQEVRITARNGTDLWFKIAERPVFVSDGVISPEERYEGGPKCQVWLPAGEVYTAPVPGTARGTFVANDFFFEGKWIQGLTLTFENGRLTNMTAKGDITALKEQYAAAPTGRDVFAALDIGINPEIKAPANSRLVTWTASGTISVGIGNNRWAGGENDVPYGLFAHLPNGTLTVDGRKLVENGTLRTP